MAKRPAILLRVGAEPELVRELECDLEPIYKLLGCDCIDMTRVHPLAVEHFEHQFAVHLGDRKMIRIIVQDDGLLVGLPLNLLASEAARQPIAGDALLMEVE